MYRSVLFVPCANTRAMAKSHSLVCDALIFDLEDAVGDDERSEALAGLVQKLDAGGFAAGKIMARLHPAHVPAMLRALRDALQAGAIQGLVIPKVGAPEDVEHVHAGLPAPVRLWAMIETARGVAHLPEIASLSAHLPLKGLIAGPNDLRHDLRTRPMPESPLLRQDILFALSQIVLHGRANGLIVLDGVNNAYQDEAGFATECQQGRSLGFDGKTLIHPSQIDIANAAFSPSAEDILWAKAVVAAFAATEAQIASVNGAMVERMHLEQAQSWLEDEV